MGMGSKVPAIIRLLLCSILTVTTAYAGPVGLPDSARPGAVRPEQEGRAEIPSAPVSEVLEVPAVIKCVFICQNFFTFILIHHGQDISHIR